MQSFTILFKLLCSLKSSNVIKIPENYIGCIHSVTKTGSPSIKL